MILNIDCRTCTYRALVAQMREALAARRAFDTEPECAINRKLFSNMDEAIAAADKWLANPPVNQCGETCERASLSRQMFVARRENMQKGGGALTASAVLALLSDCDMLASRNGSTT